MNLSSVGYIPDNKLVTTLELMAKLKRPLLLEGDAGVGKTAAAIALAKLYDCKLIRLQCYEGLDIQSSIYEWNYSKQILWINLQKENSNELELKKIFSKEFLLERPLLQAIQETDSPVLLIDEIDRADEAFEAYLLELLSEFQITIPELGTVVAKSIPRVILTSNGTRELSDALRRRCLYHYLDYPEPEREFSIIQQAIPDVNQRLLQQVVNFIHALRKQDLHKPPGIAETIDWSSALTGLNINDLLNDKEQVSDTLGCLLKTRDDQQKINSAELQKLINIAV